MHLRTKLVKPHPKPHPKCLQLMATVHGNEALMWDLKTPSTSNSVVLTSWRRNSFIAK